MLAKGTLVISSRQQRYFLPSLVPPFLQALQRGLAHPLLSGNSLIFICQNDSLKLETSLRGIMSIEQIILTVSMAPARLFLFKIIIIIKLKASTESLCNPVRAQTIKLLYMCPSLSLVFLQSIKKKKKQKNKTKKTNPQKTRGKQ